MGELDAIFRHLLLIDSALLVAETDVGLLLFCRQLIPALSCDFGLLGDYVVGVGFGNAGLLLLEEEEKAGGRGLRLVAHLFALLSAPPLLPFLLYIRLLFYFAALRLFRRLLLNRIDLDWTRLRFGLHRRVEGGRSGWGECESGLAEVTKFLESGGEFAGDGGELHGGRGTSWVYSWALIKK